MRTPDYLDLARQELGLPSDYALQKPLGVSKSQLSRWRNGLDSLSDSMAVRVAELCKIPPERVLLDAHLEKAKTPEERAAWKTIMEKFSGSFRNLLSGWTGEERRSAQRVPVSVH